MGPPLRQQINIGRGKQRPYGQIPELANTRSPLRIISIHNHSPCTRVPQTGRSKRRPYDIGVLA